MARQATPDERKMKLRRGITYSRSFLYTARADGVQVPLDDADYDAVLVVRRRAGAEEDIITLTPGDGLTLSTEDDSLRITVRIGADITADLEVGKDYKYILAISLIADPSEVTELISDEASVAETAL